MSKYVGLMNILKRCPQNFINVKQNSYSNSDVSLQQIRCYKHYNPKYKKERAAKVIKVKLPDMDEANKIDYDKITSEEIRAKMKERGVLPRRQWQEKPLFATQTGTIIDSYVPPEGDGKMSIITKQGAKQKLTFVEEKGKSMMSIRKIKSFDDTFSTGEFKDVALDIYIKAHECLANDRDSLLQYVTEKAYPEMIHNVDNKTVKWKFLESLEPARIVHARHTSIVSKDNVFAQITMRFHTQQILAVYDRFGRLMQGSEILRKDVLEYIVFEKHLANEYGRWRLHAKIIPPWMPPREMGERTFIAPKSKEEEESSKEDAVSVISNEALEMNEKINSKTPQQTV